MLASDSEVPTERSLSGFRGHGYDKGRSVVWQALWFLTMNLVFSQWWCPQALRPKILRVFGARIGDGVIIRHRVRVHWPWKLSVGDHSWIGEGVWLLNLEAITVGANVCISQEASLCTGSHDRRSPTFEFDNGPIFIEDEVWLGMQALILRGTTVGSGAVVGARAVVTKDVGKRELLRAGSAR
jgi:putative colanic acid biosynthesis acetyltransferase WcaF